MPTPLFLALFGSPGFVFGLLVTVCFIITILGFASTLFDALFPGRNVEKLREQITEAETHEELSRLRGIVARHVRARSGPVIYEELIQKIDRRYSILPHQFDLLTGMVRSVPGRYAVTGDATDDASLVRIERMGEGELCLTENGITIPLVDYVHQRESGDRKPLRWSSRLVLIAVERTTPCTGHPGSLP